MKIVDEREMQKDKTKTTTKKRTEKNKMDGSYSEGNDFVVRLSQVFSN